MQFAPVSGVATIIAEAYRWDRRLGSTVIETAHCRIVSNPKFPDVWDHNHAESVNAATVDEIADVFREMDRHLAHTSWRVFHTDCFTPDAFLARIAMDGFVERPVVIQMMLDGPCLARGADVEVRPVKSDADWAALLALVVADHREGKRTGGLALDKDFSAAVVEGYRAKGSQRLFQLAFRDSIPVAYGSCGAAPNGGGIIEDLFTVQGARKQGIATRMIAQFVDELRAAGSHTIFLGALAAEEAKTLYARLGFRPVMLSRSWVRQIPAQTAY